jgi:hypothetical protein
MKKPIRRYMLLILIAFMIIPAHAQKKDYILGYIINLEGETVNGWVKDRSSGSFFDLYKRIRFKPDNAFFKRKYSPDEILGYGINNRHYESVPLIEESAFFKFKYYLHEGNDRVFLKVISRNADLTYYHWEYVDSESNYLDYIPLLYRTGSNEMVRVTQGILGLKRKRLVEYFWDCPNMVMAIETKKLNEIHEVYNFYLEHCLRDIN